ncbi:MAG: hypothetical protein HGA78_06945 [Nitrospirales bacterium]|nr:hypothetical protein [Nitrospirales bacterium]
MALWQKLFLAGIGFIGLGLGFAILIASALWSRRTSRTVERLIMEASKTATETVSFRDFDQLPAHVARYFRLVLKEGQPLIRSARVIQEGEFRTGEADNSWRPFKATEHFTSLPRGFVWDARIRIYPLMTVRVRDEYTSGHGSMEGRINSLMPMISEHNKPELDAGALQRYLAEAVWFPTALLPGQGIQWEATGDNTARATITDSGTTVSLEFRFSEDGEITEVFTLGRYREVKGRYELTPWAAFCSVYEKQEGMRIPTEVVVEWQLPEGRFPYWKGRVVDVEYDFRR